ncbi:MAG: NAD-dependent succinate-semialdehyde dehydrogenase [Xanthobacteraceae bacterium]
MTPTAPAAARADNRRAASLADRLQDPSLLRENCFIDGAWTGTPATPVTNPVDGAELAKVPRLAAEETTAAVEAAARAFPEWAKRTAKERSNILRRWYELIVANRDDLALILTSEQGKPLTEARGEVDIGAAYVEFYAEEARRVYGETIPAQRGDARILTLRQPIGVCGAITPWNFPCSMITRKVSPALAAGCTVVLKPANETPLSALALAALAERAGIPKGVFNVLTGNSSAIGKVLCAHPAVRFVGFTGSTEVGKILYEQAAVGVKKLGLELGGNAPFIVFDDADLDAAVEGAIVSKYRNMGQTCVCANRLYAQEGIYDAFVDKLAKKVAAMKIGDGAEDGVVQGPLINKDAVDKVEKHIADAVQRGAKVITGGKRHKLGGTFFEPTVLANVAPDALVAHEETFGPLAPVFRFKDEKDVIALANNSPFGLASYFYARDLGRVWRVAEALESGMVGVNTGLITTEVAPFGGVKESGLGREGSKHGMEEYVEIKYVMMAGI